MATTTASHLHDLGITISMGDVPADLVDPAMQDLVAALQDAIDNWQRSNPYHRSPVTRKALAQLDAPSLSVTYHGPSHCPECQK